jgi:hypothetical protein
VFSVPRIGSERNSEVISLPKMVRSGIPSFFSLPKMVWSGILRFFLFRKRFGTEFRGFSLPKIVRNGISRFSLSKMVRNGIPEGFSLPRNGSERNSEGFPFRETGGIPTELPRNNFFVGNGNYSCELCLQCKKHYHEKLQALVVL